MCRERSCLNLFETTSLLTGAALWLIKQGRRVPGGDASFALSGGAEWVFLYV